MQKFNLQGLPHYHTRLSLLSSDINVLNVLQESSDITWLWLQRSWFRVLLDTPLLNLPSLGDNLLDASNERQLDLLPGSGWRLLPRRWWWWWSWWGRQSWRNWWKIWFSSRLTSQSQLCHNDVQFLFPLSLFIIHHVINSLRKIVIFHVTNLPKPRFN